MLFFLYLEFVLAASELSKTIEVYVKVDKINLN